MCIDCEDPDLVNSEMKLFLNVYHFYSHAKFSLPFQHSMDFLLFQFGLCTFKYDHTEEKYVILLLLVLFTEEFMK